MIDEATDAELKILSASFCDPYVLLLRDDSSVMILEATSSGELEEIERSDDIMATAWLSGCLFKSTNTHNKTLAFLLSTEGRLKVCYLLADMLVC
jgi:cleavage and polyadenylation specificity factor subunit 1